jgi:hypothetical protein
VTRSQTTRNRRIYPWPLRLSGEKARPDQAVRCGFHRWSFFDRVAEAASIQSGGIPHLNLTRRCRETAKEVNSTIIKSASSGACWSAPIRLPTGSSGVACRQAHSGRTGWCPKIKSATADRRRHGSLVIRNTYQTASTRNDLNHQPNHRRGTSVTVDFSHSHRHKKERPGITPENGLMAFERMPKKLYRSTPSLVVKRQ